MVLIFSWFSWSILFLAALGTSIISAITGMGGGVLLYSAMTFFMELDVLIPIHGLVQLGSNASRLYYLRKHIIYKMVVFFALGAFLGAGGATWLKTILSIPSEYPIAIVILLIIYVLFKPKKLPSIRIAFENYFFVGVAAGFLGIFIGTVGPFIAVFFVRDDLTKEEIISNKAFLQGIVHIMKIPAFLYLGFNFLSILPLTALMVAAALLGSKLGVICLKRINQKAFLILFKVCLFVAACHLTYKILI